MTKAPRYLLGSGGGEDARDGNGNVLNATPTAVENSMTAWGSSPGRSWGVAQDQAAPESNAAMPARTKASTPSGMPCRKPSSRRAAPIFATCGRIDEDEYQQFLQWKAARAGEQTDVWRLATHAFKGSRFCKHFPQRL